MKKYKIVTLILAILIFSSAIFWYSTGPKNKDPLKTQLITSDLENFWLAFDKSKPNYDPAIFQELYIDKGSKGVKGYISNRIQNAEHFSKVVATHSKYYNSIRKSMDSIVLMKGRIRSDLLKFKKLYPEAIFPPVYFVIGALNSGGTSFRNGLIIGAEMYGLTPKTPKDGLSSWHKSVLKPVNQIPHIVAHELVHFQQNNNVFNLLRGRTLLSGSIEEGSADFIAELTSGRHINDHVHDFANPKERELWVEFEGLMLGKDYSGWLNSSQEGRPNDLGYWIGYKITKSYYDNSNDKKQAIHDILNIKDFEKFLKLSKYADKFN